MSFFENLGKIGSKVADTSKKMIGKAEIKMKKDKEIKNVKISLLSQFSRQDLVNLYKSSSSISSISGVVFSNLTDTKQPSPYKMPINELIDNLTGLSDDKIYEYLLRTRRRETAEKFHLEIEQIKKKYGSEIAEIEGRKVSGASETEENMVNDVVDTLKNMRFSINENNNETQYQEQAKMFLDGAILALREKFKHFKIDVEREVPVSGDTNERIDLMLSVDNFKIGIEMKKSLDTTATSQRLLGQIDRYIDLCSALIVWIVFEKYDSVSIKKILDKAHQTGKLIRIVTPEKIFT
jgi:hypothetical protein